MAVVLSDVHEFTELLDLAKGLTPADAIEAYEAALALYKGDLLDASDMRKYRWMYDADPHYCARLARRAARAAQRGACETCRTAGAGLRVRTGACEQLYSGLCGEDFDNENLWAALFRIYERTGSSLSLEGAVRRLQNAQVELGTTDITDIDRVPLPPNPERLVQQIRRRIGGTVEPTAHID
jgi:hypothetical protein